MAEQKPVVNSKSRLTEQNEKLVFGGEIRLTRFQFERKQYDTDQINAFLAAKQNLN